MSRLPPWRPVAHRPATVVLHLSLPLEWDSPYPMIAYANRVALRMPNLVVVVPTLWSRQFAELMLARERAGQVSRAEADRYFAGMYPFQVVIDPETPALAWGDILAIARTLDLSVDDAAYLELALRLGLPLATTDATLTRAAAAAGVAIFTP